MESPRECGIEPTSSISHGVSYLVSSLCIFIYIGVTDIKIARLRWAGHVARMEESRSAFKILTGKPTGKRPLRRPRHRWEDNIRWTLNR